MTPTPPQPDWKTLPSQPISDETVEETARAAREERETHGIASVTTADLKQFLAGDD